MRRLPSVALVNVPHHPRGMLTQEPDGGLMKRYFVAHANVKSATKPAAPIAIQTHMTSPNSPVSPDSDRSYYYLTVTSLPTARKFSVRAVFGFSKLWLSPQPKIGRIARTPDLVNRCTPTPAG
jgi:hypothetical protein